MRSSPQYVFFQIQELSRRQQSDLFFHLVWQAARALANLAAHGDSNGNNAAVGRETGALEALVQLTCSTHEGVMYDPST